MVVSRRGASVRAPAWVLRPPLRRVSSSAIALPRWRSRRQLRSISSSPTRRIIWSCRATSSVPTIQGSMPSMTIGTSSPVSLLMTIHPRLADRLLLLMKPTATLWVIGSYHNIFRVGTVLQDMGFCILNQIVLAQIQPDAEFSRLLLHQRPLDTHLGGAAGSRQGAYVQRRSAQGGNDDIQMRSYWLFPLCTGEERLKAATARSCIRRKSPRRSSARVILAASRPEDLVLDRLCGHRHHRRGGGAPAPALRRFRARAGIRRGGGSVSPRSNRCPSLHSPPS